MHETAETVIAELREKILKQEAELRQLRVQPRIPLNVTAEELAELIVEGVELGLESIQARVKQIESRLK